MTQHTERPRSGKGNGPAAKKSPQRRAAPRRTPAPAQPAQADDVLALQRDAGNRAVTGLLQADQEGPQVQRDPPVAVAAAGPPVWRDPRSGAQVGTWSDARLPLLLWWSALDDLGADLRRAGVQAEPDPLRLAAEEAHARFDQAAAGGTGTLTAQNVADLTGFAGDAQQAYGQAFAVLQNELRSPLDGVGDQQPPDTSAQESQLAEQLHFAFTSGDPDRIGAIRDALDKIHDYTEKVESALTWARRGASAVGAARTVERLEAAVGGAGFVSDGLDKFTHVAQAAHAITTLSGLGNQAVAPAENDIRRFSAAIELIDAGSSLFEAVPLLGQLWSNYYLPVTQKCLELLGIIARARDVEGRQEGLIWDQLTGNQHDSDVAPTIPDFDLQYFPGGQPMLDYMWAIMRDRDPAPSGAVRNYFLEHRSLFNTGRETSEWSLESESTSHWYNPWTWGDERLTTDLTPWVRQNRDRVWAMLYGNLPHNI